MLNAETIQFILEGALFAADKPLTVNQLSALFEEHERPAPSEIKTALDVLIAEYQFRGVRLMSLAEGYCFRVCADYAPWVSRLWEEKPQKYTRAFLETLSIIAYRQPVTRGEIESIRGVAVNPNILKSLMEREWIRVVGHKDVPGHPELLATTKQFLSYFNLDSLNALPPLSEVQNLDEAAAALEQSLEGISESD
jgi:segregation and condensation protein B